MMNIIAILLVCTTFMRDSYFDLVTRMPGNILPFIHTIGGGPTMPRVAVTQPPPPVHFVAYTAASAVPSSIPTNDSAFEYTYSDPHKAYLDFDEPHTESFTPPEASSSDETKFHPQLGLVVTVRLVCLMVFTIFILRRYLFVRISVAIGPILSPRTEHHHHGTEIAHADPGSSGIVDTSDDTLSGISPSALARMGEFEVQDLRLKRTQAQYVETDALWDFSEDLERKMIAMKEETDTVIHLLNSGNAELRKEIAKVFKYPGLPVQWKERVATLAEQQKQIATLTAENERLKQQLASAPLMIPRGTNRREQKASTPCSTDDPAAQRVSEQAESPEPAAEKIPSSGLPPTDDQQQQEEPADTVSAHPSTQVTAADQERMPDDSTAQGSCNVASQPQQASHPETQVDNTPLPSTDDRRHSAEPADTVSDNASSQGTDVGQNDLPDDSTALGSSNAASQLQHTPQTGFQFGNSITSSHGQFSFAPTGSKTIAFPDPCKNCGGYVENNAEYCKKCTPRPVRRKCQGCPHNTAFPPHTLCRPCRSRKNGKGSGAGSAGLAGGSSPMGEPSAQSGPGNASSQAGESSTPDAETSAASSTNETSAESSSAAVTGGQSGSLFGRRTCEKCSGSVEGLEELCKRCASPSAKHDTSNDDKPDDGDDDDANDGSGGDRSANGVQTNSEHPHAPAQNQQENGQPAQNPESTANEQRESTSDAQTKTQSSLFSFSNTEANFWSNRAATPLSGLYAPPNPNTLLQAAGAAFRSTSVFGPVAPTTSFSAGPSQGSTATQDDASTRPPTKTGADTSGRCRVCNKPRQLAPGNGKCVLCHKVGSEDDEETSTDPFSAYSDHQKHIANAPGAVSTSQSQDDEEGIRLCRECKERKAKTADDLCEACHDEMYARK